MSVELRSRGGPRWRVLVAIAAFACLTATAWSAHGQDVRATVRLDGHRVLRVGAADGVSGPERARQIERRLSTLLAQNASLPPPEIEPSADGARRAVVVLGVPVVTVTREDAEDYLTTTDALSRQWAETLAAALEQAQEQRGSMWGRLGTETTGAVRTAFGGVLESSVRVLPRALAAGLVLLLFWSVAWLVRASLRALLKRVISDLTLENLIKQLAYYSVWVLGMVVAIDAFGIDRRSVITGLGVSSLALGFALKDILSNFVSGLLLLVLRPFRVDDEIAVGETEGRVTRVRLRATEIRTYDGRLVLVPNSEVFTSRVVNNTASPIRRATLRALFGYDVDVEQVMRVALEAVARTREVLSEPAPNARVAELGSADVVIEVQFWTDSRRSDFVQTLSAARLAVLAAAKEHCIRLPDAAARVVTVTVDREPSAVQRGLHPPRRSISRTPHVR